MVSIYYLLYAVAMPEITGIPIEEVYAADARLAHEYGPVELCRNPYCEQCGRHADAAHSQTSTKGE